MPEKCDRKGASPTESAAIQDWAKGTLWSWYAEITSRHIRRTRYVHREGIPSAFKKGAEDLNAGGTAGNRHDQSRPGMQLCIPRAGLFCYEHLAPVF